jgi:4-hydroxy-3-polyprenylbenzoate decarboxylase
MPGVVAIELNKFENYENAKQEMEQLNQQLSPYITELKNTPLLILCDDATFVSDSLNNYLWVAYTRCNPSHDIYGIDSFTEYKHWGCKGPLILDARIKPHHAPPLIKNEQVEKRVDEILKRAGVK